MTLGERIVAFRKEFGITQKRLAELIGVSATRLNYWEKGKANPSLEYLGKISEALNVSIDYLNGNKQWTFIGAFGQRLKNSRISNGITIEELADASGISAKEIQALENAKHEPNGHQRELLYAVLKDDSLNMLDWNSVIEADDPEKEELVYKFHLLDSADKGKTIAYIDGLLESDKYQ